MYCDFTMFLITAAFATTTLVLRLSNQSTIRARPYVQPIADSYDSGPYIVIKLSGQVQNDKKDSMLSFQNGPSIIMKRKARFKMALSKTPQSHF